MTATKKYHSERLDLANHLPDQFIRATAKLYATGLTATGIAYVQNFMISAKNGADVELLRQKLADRLKMAKESQIQAAMFCYDDFCKYYGL
jgi:hypothetical protein